MFLLPYLVDVPMSRWPITNFLLIAVTVSLFAAIKAGFVPPQAVDPYILRLGVPNGIYGHIFLHFGYLHLFGNMMFLWVFGNAVCAKIGNLAYVIVYLVLGCVAGITHLFISGDPAIGASGAVNGIVGMYLVLYPLNNVSCFYWFFIRIGTFYLSGVWIILFGLAFDVYGALHGGGHVAYWAHLGGFATGFLIAALLLYSGLVQMTSTERSLVDMLRDESRG